MNTDAVMRKLEEMNKRMSMIQKMREDETEKIPYSTCPHFNNSMLYWYPKIEGKVPTPKTVLIPLPRGFMKWMDAGNVPDIFLAKLKTAGKKVGGFPVFMRTDTTSAKFMWNETCFVESAKQIGAHLYRLLDENMCADMGGEVFPNAIAIREFLHLKKFFNLTHHHGMPVAREFRFFAQNGVIKCVHPYWPRSEMIVGEPDIPNWENKLAELNDTSVLTEHVKDLVRTASKQFEDAVSVDVCETENDTWYVCDMACASQSVHLKHNASV